MDKELLRIVIIATGLLVIVGMLLWAFVKGKNSRQDRNFYDDGDFIGEFDDSIIIHNEHDDFDIVPLGPARQPVNNQDKTDRYHRDDSNLVSEPDDFGLETEDDEPEPRFSVPEIIQFSVIAKADEGFNGIDLVGAMHMAGLEYGSLKIFERIDANQLIDFGVANLVAPGTFPDKDLASFYCPGVVFFMQPAQLEDAAAVFEDYMETIELLAAELDGEILDHQRQALTDATVQLIRQSL